MLVSITRQGLVGVIQFAYDEDLVALVRTIPGRRWRPETKRWTIPAAQINGCAALFHEAGCTVTVDGDIWTPDDLRSPSAPSSRVELLSRMFALIPERLTHPTHRALIRVWHPDTGGDHQLAQDLNHVWNQSPRRSS